MQHIILNHKTIQCPLYEAMKMMLSSIFQTLVPTKGLSLKRHLTQNNKMYVISSPNLRLDISCLTKTDATFLDE